jgi:Uma2 family endonuclease
MTEEQFVAWAARTERRAEWVDGEVQLMNAAEFGHVEYTDFLKELLRRFSRQFALGRVTGEPYQVRLPRRRRRRQPDVYLIIEVVSPGSQAVDRKAKFREYESAGVAEYWLPDPLLRTFEAYAIGSNGLYGRLPEVDGKVFSTVMTGAFFRPEWLRQLHPPDPDLILAEMSAERARLLSSSPSSAPNGP